MITSMTGYGRGSHKANDLEIAVEIRSVNNRFLDVVAKIPRFLSNFEQKFRNVIGQYVKRGRINVWVSLSNGNGKFQKFSYNKALAEGYMSIQNELQKEFGLNGELDINQLLSLPDLVEVDNSETADEAAWECAKKALENALVNLNEMRLQEGHELLKDLEMRINNIENLVSEIETVSKDAPVEELDKLRSRVQKLVANHKIDEGRLELELALISDRIDITEECVRFHSHNKLFKETLLSDDSEGRRLNFILQEMNREANTIGAKTASSTVSHFVVQIKEEVERIREQVQNIE